MSEWQVIRFLKRHVWPWSEIERQRKKEKFWRGRAAAQEKIIANAVSRAHSLQSRLKKYVRCYGNLGVVRND